MSSTNKTENLGLNSWIGSDKPKRVDFNTDNEIIDKAITEHEADMEKHITQQERDRWNNYMYTGVYYGNGSVQREIDTNCPFEARAGFVFANSRTISVTRFDDSQNINYFGLFGLYANTIGITLDLDGKTLRLTQSTSAVTVNEYANYNESGVAYQYVLFR